MAQHQIPLLPTRAEQQHHPLTFSSAPGVVASSPLYEYHRKHNHIHHPRHHSHRTVKIKKTTTAGNSNSSEMNHPHHSSTRRLSTRLSKNHSNSATTATHSHSEQQQQQNTQLNREVTNVNLDSGEGNMNRGSEEIFRTDDGVAGKDHEKVRSRRRSRSEGRASSSKLRSLDDGGDHSAAIQTVASDSTSTRSVRTAPNTIGSVTDSQQPQQQSSPESSDGHRRRRNRKKILSHSRKRAQKGLQEDPATAVNNHATFSEEDVDAESGNSSSSSSSLPPQAEPSLSHPHHHYHHHHFPTRRRPHPQGTGGAGSTARPAYDDSESSSDNNNPFVSTLSPIPKRTFLPEPQDDDVYWPVYPNNHPSHQQSETQVELQQHQQQQQQTPPPHSSPNEKNRFSDTRTPYLVDINSTPRTPSPSRRNHTTPTAFVPTDSRVGRSGAVVQFTLGANLPKNKRDDSDVDSSSEDALERRARRIRTELRQAEMMEVAAEAERAAAAGEMRFSARPSTFAGANDDDNDDTATTMTANGVIGMTSPFLSTLASRPSFVTRRQTYSEGIKVAARRTPSKAIGLMALRDMNEVFPNFSDFHSHLRTHFLRHGVNERCLAFYESGGSILSPSNFNSSWANIRTKGGSSTMTADGPDQNHQPALSNASSTDHRVVLDSLSGSKQKMQRPKARQGPEPSKNPTARQTVEHFFPSFSFDHWVSPKQSPDTKRHDKHVANEEAKQPVVDVLAEHLHTPSDNGSGYATLPSIHVPPGLELPDLELIHRTNNDEKRMTCDLGSDLTCHGRTPPQQKQSLKSCGRHFTEQKLTTGLSNGCANTSSATQTTASTTPNPSLEMTYSGGRQALGTPPSNRPNRVDVSPKALFDHDEDDSDVESISGEANGSPCSILAADSQSATEKQLSSLPIVLQLPSTPVARDDVNCGDFVTPARLRDIRDSEKDMSASVLPGHCRSFAASQNILACSRSVEEHPTISLDEYQRMGNSSTDAMIKSELDAAASAALSSHSILIPEQFTSGSIAENELGQINDPLATTPPRIQPRPGPEMDVAEKAIYISQLTPAEPFMPMLSVIPAAQPAVIPAAQPVVIPAAQSAVARETSQQQASEQAISAALVQESQRMEQEESMSSLLKACRIAKSPSSRSPSMSLRESLNASAENVNRWKSSQHLSMSVVDSQVRNNLSTDCSCLALSPACSSDEEDLDNSLIKDRRRRPWENAIRRSSSAGALAAIDTPRNRWNPFAAQTPGNRGSRPFEDAIAMLTRLSPRLRARKLFNIRAEENDDFLRNYLYCSKPTNIAASTAANNSSIDAYCNTAEPCHEDKGHCAEINAGMCCVPLLPDSGIRDFLLRTTGRQGHTSLLSLSGGQPVHRVESETWFDVATERFDEVLEKLMGSASRHGKQWNANFQAPALKKTVASCQQLHGSSFRNSLGNVKASLHSIPESISMEGGNSRAGAEEKKFDCDSEQFLSQRCTRLKHVRGFSMPPLISSEEHLSVNSDPSDFQRQHRTAPMDTWWGSLATTRQNSGAIAEPRESLIPSSEGRFENNSSNGMIRGEPFTPDQLALDHDTDHESNETKFHPPLIVSPTF